MPTLAAIRQMNRARLLAALWRRGAMTRAEIARELDVMRSTAGSLVATLLDEGFLREGPDMAQAPREIGRPGTRVELNAAKAHFLGADVGVGSIRVVLLDLQSRTVSARQATFAPLQEPPERTLDRLADLVADILRTDGARQGVQGLCVSVPGPVDLDGVLWRAPMLGWFRVPVREMICRRLPDLAEIRVENDANAFALQAILRSVEPMPDDALFLWIDAGVGGAIWAGGRLHRGHRGCAAEFGHLYVGENAVASGSPLPGSLESFVGRLGILQRYREASGGDATLAEYLTHLAQGSDPARACLRTWSDALARGLAALTSAFDPAQIMIGGPMAALLPHAMEETREALTRCLVDPALAPEIVATPADPDSAAIGCALALTRDFIALETPSPASLSV